MSDTQYWPSWPERAKPANCLECDCAEKAKRLDAATEQAIEKGTFRPVVVMTPVFAEAERLRVEAAHWKNSYEAEHRYVETLEQERTPTLHRLHHAERELAEAHQHIAALAEDITKPPLPGLVYLASPYSHPLEYVQQTRFEQACAAAAALMRQGVYVFSPIAHTHPIACAGQLPTGWDFWQPYDRLYLQACERMIVLQLEGWDESKGVSDEIFIMQSMGKPVEYVTLESLLDCGLFGPREETKDGNFI